MGQDLIFCEVCDSRMSVNFGDEASTLCINCVEEAGQKNNTPDSMPPLVKEIDTSSINVSSAGQNRSNWKTVTRDAVLIYILTFLVGFVIGLTGPSPESFALAALAGFIIFLTIGFFISGCIVKNNRFQHLLKVALLLWIFSLANLALGATMFNWFVAGILMSIPMAIGGGASFLLVKPETT